MPFTLAHPAAVLPFRKYCPRWLSFPALVAGSLSPDLGYCFRTLEVDKFSHDFVGSFAFCLPAGLLILGLFYASRSLALRLLPSRRRPTIMSLYEVPLGSPLVVVISVIFGAWTHLFCDAFTNHHGWLVRHLEVLRIGVGTLAGHTVRICHLLWCVSSFAGVLCLSRAFQKSQSRPSDFSAESRHNLSWLTAVLVASLVLPISVLHYLVHGLAGMGFVAVLSALLVLGGAAVMSRPTQVTPLD